MGSQKMMKTDDPISLNFHILEASKTQPVAPVNY